MNEVQTKYPVVDVFAGPGGLGEGFSTALRGRAEPCFQIILSFERDEFAHKTLFLRHFLRHFPYNEFPEEYYDYLKSDIALDELYRLYPNEFKNAKQSALRLSIEQTLIFKRTEKLVSAQTWYDGGYRANIVIYAIALIREICDRHEKSVDYLRIWNTQDLTPIFIDSLATAAKFANEIIVYPPSGISNVTEWCKKDACWTALQSKIETLESLFPVGFWDELISQGEQDGNKRDARKTQKIDNGIDAQMKALEIGAHQWETIFQGLSEKGNLSPKETGILKVARQIPGKIPSEKQSMVLMDILEKAQAEGI